MTLSIDIPQPYFSTLQQLRTLIGKHALCEGRSDSLLPGLRYYHFSKPTEYQKKQLLMPGIVIVLQGSKQIKLTNRVLSYNENTYLVLGSDAICHGSIVTACADQPYLAIHLDLPTALLVKVTEALARTGQAKDTISRQSYVAPVNNLLLDAFLRLVNASTSITDRITIAPLILEEIIIRLLQSEVAQGLWKLASVPRIANRIQKSMDYIQENFARPLGIIELAKQVAMSPSHYSHSFRQIAGITPIRYLKNVRLEAAKSLLLEKNLRPAEIASQVGFESVEHFTREFRNRFDATPVQYATNFSSPSISSNHQ